MVLQRAAAAGLVNGLQVNAEFIENKTGGIVDLRCSGRLNAAIQ